MYNAMAGLGSGYLPNYVATHSTYSDAVKDLVSLHDLSTNQEQELPNYGNLFMDIGTHGNAYCEIEKAVE